MLRSSNFKEYLKACEKFPKNYSGPLAAKPNSLHQHNNLILQKKGKSGKRNFLHSLQK